MEFITVEQFQEQPVEVQKVFLEWWKCDYGDLYYYNEYPYEEKEIDIINNGLECDLNEDFEYFKSIGVIPLFTEGQLRKFIEDKTSMEIEILKSSSVGKCVGTMFYDRKESGNAPKYKVDEIDLFQAYWKVACIVAKEGLNE